MRRVYLSGAGVALAAAMSIAPGKILAKTAAEEIKELRDVIASNSVVRVPRNNVCRYYNAWYVDLCTPEEREAILERNIAAHRRWIELGGGKSAAARADLGNVYGIVGRWEEAKPVLAAALADPAALDPMRLAAARWNMANCLWLEGDFAGATNLIAEVAAIYGTGAVDDFISSSGRARFLAAVFAGAGEELDMLKLPHSTDGRPFPSPQEEEYGAASVPLARVALDAVGVPSRDAAAVRLLRRKLTRFGAKFEKGGTGVVLRLADDAPVDRPQGYSIDVEDGKVIIQARTRLGLTWGVVSFLQCVDRKALSIRTMRIRDWPVCARRGVIPYWKPEMAEFALFNKMSYVTFNMGREWVLDPLDQERYRLFGGLMNDLGIEVYFIVRDIAMKPLLPLSSPRTRSLHLERMRFIASCGAGASLHLDDHRFPLHPLDLESAGAAANLDAEYVTGLYRQVKAEHPGFRMQFCPPFYWGPDGRVAYPEPRDGYLKSLGKSLDHEIDVYWTGPRVKTHYMTEEKAKWYSDLIGRKPIVFHNGNAIGQHNYIQYGADPTGYRKSHAPDIFDHIAAFQQNISHYSEGGEAGSAMDWCWNPLAHDGRESVRRAVNQFEGPGVFELIEAATPSLSYFDKYGTGVPRGELFAEDQADLDRRVAAAEETWRKVESVAANGGMFVKGFNKSLGWNRRLAGLRRNPPEWLRKQYEAAKANTAFAIEEVGFDEAKGDVFLPAELLQGGRFFKSFKDACGKARDAKLVESGFEVGGRFPCEPFPNDRPFTMYVAGMRYLDPWEKPAAVPSPQMEVEVNGRVVWRGQMFDGDSYGTMEIKLPVDAIERTNVFKIRNAGPFVKDEGRPIINYVVIRK